MNPDEETRSESHSTPVRTGRPALHPTIRHWLNRLKSGFARPPGENSALLQPILAAVLVTLVCLTIPPPPPDLDADPAWTRVLVYAHAHQLQFGTEIVFTYGPLGFLIAPYFFGQPLGWLFGGVSTLCFVISLGLCLLAWRLNPWWRYLLLGIFVFESAGLEPRVDLLIDLGIFLWGLLSLVENGRRLIASLCGLMALVAFGALAKMTFVFFGGLTAIAVAGDLLLRRRWWLGLGLIPVCGLIFVLGWLLMHQGVAHIVPFLANGFLISRDYDQAAGLEGLATLRERGFLVALLVLAVAWIRAGTAFDANRAKLWGRRAVLFIWTSGLLFMVWKHSLVRVDRFHVVNLLGFAPVMALALESLPTASKRFRWWALGLASACCLLSLITVQEMFFPALRRSVLFPFSLAKYHLQSLVHPQAYQRMMDQHLASFTPDIQLPRSCKVIGNATIDVFGTFQLYVLLNGLNYHPRPVFQSYAAYSPKLARLNQEFYVSEAAPEFILFRLFAHERRVPALNDGPALREILINYEPVDAEGEFLLLKRKSRLRANLTLLQTGTVNPGQPVVLSAWRDQDLWLEFTMKPNLLGRIVQFLYRPPPIHLSVWQEHPRTLLARRRCGTLLLEIGFVANPGLLRTDDVRDLYTGERLLHPDAYSVDLPAGGRELWQQNIGYRVYRIENRLGRCISPGAIPLLEHPVPGAK